LVLFGTCLVTVFDLAEVLMTSVGLADGGPSSYYQSSNIPKFGALVARNRGVSVDVFADFKAAEEWLLK
jgi:hypothetical protein